MALRYELATYDPVTYLVGDEIVSGTPTFVHTATIYAKDYLGAWQSFGANKRVVNGGRYVSDTEVYANFASTLDRIIAQDSDDAEESTTSQNTNVTSSDLELVYDAGISSNQLVGLRFQNITIPKDANISSAYLSFKARVTSSVECNLYIDVEAHDSAPTFVAGTGNADISSRTLVGTLVDWLDVEAWTSGEWYNSVDISSLITAITTRSGWVSGNNIAFVITGDINDLRSAEAYSGAADSEPKLHIEFEDGSTLLDPLPMTVYQPAATNLLWYSTAIDNAYWSVYRLVANSLNELIPDTNIEDHQFYDYDQISLSFDTSYVTTVEVKAGNSNWVAVAAFIADTGWSGCKPVVWFNLSTGEIGTETTLIDTYSSITSVKGIIEPLENDWYQCSVVWEIASFSSPLHYRGVMLYPVDGDDSIAHTGDGATVHSYLRQLQCHEGVYPVGPIYTTSSTEATDEIINTYPSANWSNSEGPIYIEFDYTGEDQVILLNDDVPILYVTSDVLYLDDGTNTTSIACSTVGEHKVGIVLDSSGGNMRLNLDGTWSD